MILMVNWTPGIRWRPKWVGRRDRDLWFYTLIVLGVEITLYSRRMGAAVIDEMNARSWGLLSGKVVEQKVKMFDYLASRFFAANLEHVVERDDPADNVRCVALMIRAPIDTLVSANLEETVRDAMSKE